MSSSALRLPQPDFQPDWAATLLADGYCIVPDLLSAGKVRALHEDLKPRLRQTPFCEGNFFGTRTKRFGGILKRSPHAAALVQHPLVLDMVQTVLGPHCDNFQLNLTQVIEIWPGEPEQVPHRDHDMWGGPKGEMEFLVNVMWPFTPFTAENGATLVWPGTHGAQCQTNPDRSHAISAAMNPGSALLWLGSTLHCGGSNRARLPRAGVVVSYSLGWLKPYENQWLVYPPDIARHFSPELAALVGYRQHRPNLGNYEGQCPSVLLKDHVPEHLHGIDAIKEEHLGPLAEYKAYQLSLANGKM